jgi:hypothetical protein
MPGLRRYLVGKVVQKGDESRDFHRIAALYWDDRKAFEEGIAYLAEGKSGGTPMSEWAIDTEAYTADMVEIPDATDSGGADTDNQGLLSVWLFNFLPVASYEETERYYLEAYSPHIRKMPGLRQYLVGSTFAMGEQEPRFSRLTTLEIDGPPSGDQRQMPPWVRPMPEWCRDIESYTIQFEEVAPRQ